MIYDEDVFNKIKYRKENFFKLYYSVLNNRNLSIDELISNINSELDTTFNFESLKNYLERVKRDFSVTKTEIMLDILEYASSKNEKLKAKIENQIKLTSIRGLYKSTNDKNVNLHKDIMERLLSEMNTIIKEDKSYSQLLEEGIITDNKIYTNANKYIKEIDDNTYIDFLISYKQIEKISIDELSKLKKALESLIENNTKNIELLKSCNPTNGENKIRCLYVFGEQELSDVYTKDIVRLHKWKIKRLEVRLSYYMKLYLMVEKLISTKDISSLEKLSLDKRFIDNDEIYVNNQGNNLQKVYNTFDQIKKIHNISDSRNKTLRKIYNDKIITENN